MTQDDQKQLKLLGIFHYVSAGLACTIPIMGGLYAAFGVAIVLGRIPGSAPRAPDAFGWLIVALGAFILMLGAGAVALNLLTARSLRERNHHTLCMLTSALNCMHFPLGTLLGTFTLIVLCRAAVRAAFESSRSCSGDRAAAIDLVDDQLAR